VCRGGSFFLCFFFFFFHDKDIILHEYYRSNRSHEFSGCSRPHHDTATMTSITRTMMSGIRSQLDMYNAQFCNKLHENVVLVIAVPIEVVDPGLSNFDGSSG